MIDCHAFLPPITLNWCTFFLDNAGYSYPSNLQTTSETGCTMAATYGKLKEAVRLHLLQSLEPTLAECERPLGGYSWQSPTNIVHPQLANVTGVDLGTDGPDTSLG